MRTGSVLLVATELLVLLVVWLAGRIWRLEPTQAKTRWTVATALIVLATTALIAAHPAGKDEPSLELICGGALGLLVMMTSRFGRPAQ